MLGVMLLSKPFTIGDWIKVGDDIGLVTAIGLKDIDTQYLINEFTNPAPNLANPHSRD